MTYYSHVPYLNGSNDLLTTNLGRDCSNISTFTHYVSDCGTVRNCKSLNYWCTLYTVPLAGSLPCLWLCLWCYLTTGVLQGGHEE